MARIFLSYSHEDKAAAKRLVEALAREGLEAWWDHEIPPGRTWDEVIGARITAADIVIVLWSKRSVASNFVKEEAQLALDAGKLLPLRIELVEPPIGFRRVHAANLSDWRGEAGHGQWRVVLNEIQSRLGDAPLTPRRGGSLRVAPAALAAGAALLTAACAGAWFLTAPPAPPAETATAPASPPPPADVAAVAQPQAPAEHTPTAAPTSPAFAPPAVDSIAQTVWEGPVFRDSGRSSRWAVRFNADGTAAIDFMDGRGFIDTGAWTWSQTARSVQLQHTAGNYGVATVHGAEMSGTLTMLNAPQDSGTFRFERK